MDQNFIEKNKYGIIFFTGFILTLLFTGGMISGQILLGQDEFVVSVFGSVIFEQTTTNRTLNNFNLGFSAVLIGVLLMVLFKGYEKLNEQKNKDA